MGTSYQKPLLILAGLELFFIEGGGGPQWGAPSAFFAFPNAVEAGKAAEAMLTQAALGEALPGGKAAASAAGSILEVRALASAPWHCIILTAIISGCGSQALPLMSALCAEELSTAQVS